MLLRATTTLDSATPGPITYRTDNNDGDNDDDEDGDGVVQDIDPFVVEGHYTLDSATPGPTTCGVAGMRGGDVNGNDDNDDNDNVDNDDSIGVV